MRTIEQIKESIAKKEEAISKIERKIERLIAKVSPEGAEIAKVRDREARMAYVKNLNCDEEWDFDDLWRAYGDLAGAKDVLAKYNVELEKANNFANEEKIPAIWEFLLDWASKARAYCLDNANLLFRLVRDEEKEYEAWKVTDEHKERVEFIAKHNLRMSDDSVEYYVNNEWKKNYYFAIGSLTRDITSIKFKRTPLEGGRSWETKRVAESYSVDEAKMDGAITKERDAKYRDLVHRITDVAGEILDASGLSIGAKGNICGIVKGSRKNVYVETIPCAGYNIVRFHYRVIVNALKSLNEGK